MHSAAWRKSRHTLTSSVANSSICPFAQALQQAAGRAWKRRSSSFTRVSTKPTRTPSRYDNIETSSPFWRVPAPSISEPYLDPERLVDDDFCVEHARTLEFEQLPDDIAYRELPLLSVAIPSPVLQVPSLPRATTPKILLRNMQYLANKSSKPTLVQLIHYHALHHKSRSAHTYNFLIELALRHNQFKHVQDLFDDMRRENLSQTTRSKKLLIRWLVATGRQAQAWTLMTQLAEESGGDIPPQSLWLELLKRPQRMDSPPLLPDQFLALLRVRPIPVSEQSSPRLVGTILGAALSASQGEFALKTAQRYLSSLPFEIEKAREKYMDIVDLFVLKASDARTPVLKFMESRQILQSLLSLHPALRPTPKTLLALFSHLRACRNAGTLAIQTLDMFKLRWGPDVENRVVRRLVVELIVKEGRHLAVAERLAQLEDNYVSREFDFLDETQTAEKPTVMRDDKVYPHTGRENVNWVRTKARLAAAEQARERHHSNAQLQSELP